MESDGRKEAFEFLVNVQDEMFIGYNLVYLVIFFDVGLSIGQLIFFFYIGNLIFFIFSILFEAVSSIINKELTTFILLHHIFTFNVFFIAFGRISYLRFTPVLFDGRYMAQVRLYSTKPINEDELHPLVRNSFILDSIGLEYLFDFLLFIRNTHHVDLFILAFDVSSDLVNLDHISIRFILKVPKFTSLD